MGKMVILIVNDLLTTMGTGRARMKTPMRAHSPRPEGTPRPTRKTPAMPTAD